ncbi:hypothetical protein BGZ52_010117, partial [Haplosporangium bisporale]
AVQAVEEKLGATSLASLAESVKEELQRGFTFWEVVVDAVKAQGSGVSKDVVQEFTEANNWIKARKV